MYRGLYDTLKFFVAIVCIELQVSITKKFKCFYLQAFMETIFPGPLALCRKAVEELILQENILNNSLEWSVVLTKVIYIYCTSSSGQKLGKISLIIFIAANLN